MGVAVRGARIEDSAAIIEMADALNRYEGKPPTPLTEESLARHMFGPERMLTCVVAELDSVYRAALERHGCAAAWRDRSQ